MNGIAAIEQVGPSMADVERAHASLNAAYSAIAADRIPQTLARDADLARGYVHEARTHLHAGTGHAATEGARAAARAVLPRLDHALHLIDLLATTRDQSHIDLLLDELGTAMDHVETALAGAGWD